MRIIKVVAISIMLSPATYGYLEVPEQIKAPSEVAEQVKEFLRDSIAVQEDAYLTDEQRVALMERAQTGKQLLIDAYVINHMCQVSLECNRALLDWFEKGNGEIPESVNDIHRLIRMYQGDACASEAVAAMHYEEFKVINADCL